MSRRFVRLLVGQLQHLREHCDYGNYRFFHDQLFAARLLALFNGSGFAMARWTKLELQGCLAAML